MRKNTKSKSRRALGGLKATPRPRATASAASAGPKQFTASVRLYAETEQYRRDMRDIYAGLALVTLGPTLAKDPAYWRPRSKEIAEACFEFAVAMMNERERRDAK